MKSQKKFFHHWLSLTVLGTTLTLGVLSFIRAIETVGQPFSGFFFGPNLLVGVGQREEWPGIQAGLKSLDKLVAVNGTEMKSGAELLENIANKNPGEVLFYKIERGGVSKEFKVPVSRHSLADFMIVFLAPFLMGLLFVSFGAILYFAQPLARGSILYLSLCCVVGAFCMTVYEAYTSFAFFRVILIYPIIGALSVHLFSLFPITQIYRPRIKTGVITLYIIALVLILWRQVLLYNASKSLILSKLSSLYVLLVLMADIFLLVRAYQFSTSQVIKDKIKVFGVGLFIASSVVAVWSLNFLLVTKSFYLDEGILLASVFPLFMGYAVLRKNVFELDRVIRLSLSYGTTAAVFFVLYLGIVGTMREWAPYMTSGRYIVWLTVLLAAGGAILFNLLRLRINSLVHKFLFRSRYDLGEALTALDRSLITGLSVGDLAQRLGQRLGELLNLEKVAVLCLSGHVEGGLIVRYFRWPEPPAVNKWISLFEAEGFLEKLRCLLYPVDVTELSVASADFYRQSLATLSSHQIEVVLPCVSSGKIFGIVFLGRKQSRDRYDHTDLKLLQPIALRMGILLENSELASEADRQARLVALGQMASVLIHDIKNPLSTIKISAGTIKRRFKEGDHCFELATFIEEEVDRMAQTIHEILTFARPSGASLKKCSIKQVIMETFERVAPILKKSQIQLDLNLLNDDVLIEADGPRLSRAIENLLINAKDATPQGGLIKLKLFADGKNNGHSRIKISIEDNGKGMEPSIREQIFKPFFTTKPNGTGLGLAIVKQVVTEHGGDLELETRSQVGTKFTLAFPIPKINS